MKTFILSFLLLASVSLSQEPVQPWVEIARRGEHHMRITLHNPSQVHFALQVSYDLQSWGYLGSTTNAIQVFDHCYVGLYTNAGFYRARSWNGPPIPQAPPCN